MAAVTRPSRAGSVPPGTSAHAVGDGEIGTLSSEVCPAQAVSDSATAAVSSAASTLLVPIFFSSMAYTAVLSS